MFSALQLYNKSFNVIIMWCKSLRTWRSKVTGERNNRSFELKYPVYSCPLRSDKIGEEGAAVRRLIELKLINRDQCGGEVPVKLVELQTAAESNV